MEAFAVKEYIGSTSSFHQLGDGAILKSLWPIMAERDAYKVTVERRILEILGDHPRIIKYKGFYDNENIRGLMFAEASHGNLQKYLDQNNESISLHTRKRWCMQVTMAIQHIHSHGVIHSDLRPENCLLHKSNGSLDLLLCDFGGSMCENLDLDGRGLPDPPFWDVVWKSTPGTDIFSLGSTFYTIMTGHWPYKSAPPAKDNEKNEEESEDRWQYEDRVMDLMKQGAYPDIGHVVGGTIMMSCWKKQYATAKDVLLAQNAQGWDHTRTEFQAGSQQEMSESGMLGIIYRMFCDLIKFRELRPVERRTV